MKKVRAYGWKTSMGRVLVAYAHGPREAAAKIVPALKPGEHGLERAHLTDAVLVTDERKAPGS